MNASDSSPVKPVKSTALKPNPNSRLSGRAGLFCSAVLWLLISGSLAAAEQERPKIGLALSGGGARGLAHIGVLQALHDKRIPIDYIAGTSMGSIIGGLYATGMNTDDLDWVVASVDWDSAFSPAVDRELKNYRQKQEEKDYFVDLEIGLSRKGPKSGVGIAGDQKIMLELQRLVGSIDADNFDDFPIPFRAVATDLNAGEPYVIDHGDLALAMRASMAVPLIFGPIKHQGRMLVDGGILNNLPVDVVRKMGADIVIAVNIASPLGAVDETSSVLSVTYQSVDVALVQNTIESLGLADIVIAPKLEKVAATDFDKNDQMVADGYHAVAEKSLVLDHLALSEHDYRVHQESRNFLVRNVPEKIRFVRFSGNQRTATARLQAYANNLINQSFETGQVQRIADKIAAAEQDIQIITYHVVSEDEEKGIEFNVQEKQWGPDYVKFGLKIADDFDSNTRISVLARHQRFNINDWGGQWINDFSVGSLLQWKSEFYQPIEAKRDYFLSANLHSIKDTRRFYQDDTRAVGEYDLKRFALGFDFGININANSEFRAGLWFRDEDVNNVINSTNFDTAIDRSTGLLVRYGLDTQEKALYSREGYDIETELGLFNKVQWISFNGFKRIPLGKTSAAHFGIKADFTDLVDDDQFFKAYGGLDDFAGFPQHSLLGLNAFLFEFGGFTKLDPIKLPVVGTPNLIVKVHYGNVWQRHIKLDDMILGFSAGLSIDVENTVMYVGSGYSDGGDIRFYLRLGTGF